MKKKLALTITSIALVAAVAIGGTLAWMTSQTDVLTNTFTATDNIAITLTEPSWKANSPIVPGVAIAKDPTVAVTKDAGGCYVYMLVEDTMTVTVDGEVVHPADYGTLGQGWTKSDVDVGANKALYVYGDAVTTESTIPALFTEVTFDATVVDGVNMATMVENGSIKIVAYAHQSTGTDMTHEIATTAATTWATDFDFNAIQA